MKKKLFIAGAAFALLFQGCLKDNFDMDKLAQGKYTPDIAIPLAYASVTIQDIIDTTGINSTVEVDANNFCTIVYSGNLLSKKASEIVSIPEQSTNFSTNFVGSFIQLSNGQSVTFTETISFQSGSTQIDNVEFRTLRDSLVINNNTGAIGTITVAIPAAIKSGMPYSSAVLTLSPGTNIIVLNLDGYTIDMTKSGTTTNTFDVNYTIQFPAGSTINATNSFAVTSYMKTIAFKKIIGYIGQQALSPFQDTVDINLFKKAFGTGTFKINDPTIRMDITNSYGIPIRVDFTRFDGYNPNSSPQIITIQGAPQNLMINYPSLAEIGQSKVTSIILDKNTTNGTIVGALNNNKSAYLIYQPNSLSNPTGATTPRNFILDDSQFNVDIDVRLPLWGSAKDFTLEDTIRDFRIDNIGEIDNFLLRAYVVNGFPIDLDVQVYFVDSLFRGPVVNGVPTKAIDSLATSDLFMRSAAIDSDGRATTPSIHTHDYPYDKARIERLKDARHLILRARASSTNNGASDVKIYATDKLDLKLGVRTKINSTF